MAALKKDWEEANAKVHDLTQQWEQAEEEHKVATKAHEEAILAAHSEGACS